jgi:hypothetical protein
MNRRSTALLLLALAWASQACNEDEARYEVIDKLRGLGVAAAPLVATPSTGASQHSVTLTFHAAVPLGETVTAEPYVDDASKYAFPVPLQIVAGSAKYQDLAAFRHYSVQATVAVPTAAALAIPADPGFQRIRYGLVLRSGSEEEKIVGNFAVYPEGATEADWEAPTAEVSAPASGTTVSGEEDLKATIANSIGEPIRVAWFVSAGEVLNRRAKETTWDTGGSGPQTVIFTARGRRSGAFVMRAIDVVVE